MITTPRKRPNTYQSTMILIKQYTLLLFMLAIVFPHTTTNNLSILAFSTHMCNLSICSQVPIPYSLSMCKLFIIITLHTHFTSRKDHMCKPYKMKMMVFNNLCFTLSNIYLNLTRLLVYSRSFDPYHFSSSFFILYQFGSNPNTTWTWIDVLRL